MIEAFRNQVCANSARTDQVTCCGFAAACQSTRQHYPDGRMMHKVLDHHSNVSSNLPWFYVAVLRVHTAGRRPAGTRGLASTTGTASAKIVSCAAFGIGLRRRGSRFKNEKNL
jgi:hypothetical protein